MWKFAAFGLLLLTTSGAAPIELEVQPERPVEGTVEGKPIVVRVESSGLNRLTLASPTVARLGIKPAPLFGKAELRLAGRKELTGYNRPVDFAIAGAVGKTRAFWLSEADLGGAEATIGPWGVPQSRVRFVLGGRNDGAKTYRFPLGGDINSQAYTMLSGNGVTFAVAFQSAGPRKLPIASAAMGAFLAKVFGGHVSGPSWDEPIIFGIKRPLRLLTLDQPVEIGPFRFTQLAVRVPDRVDEAGRGGVIREADQEEDPSEVVVTASSKGRKPAYSLEIPPSALAACISLTFDKAARTIELVCAPDTP